MRTLNDIVDGFSFPEKGVHECVCTETKKGASSTKKTPFVKLIWVTADSEHQFTDDVYATGKALARLMLVAKRVCNAPAELPLDDDDGKASLQLAAYIADNAKGKRALVEIEENEEIELQKDGPNIGQKITTIKKRVAFRGYHKFLAQTEEALDPVEPPNFDTPTSDEDLPF
ncbi:MAG TPA: hypothetical protein VMW44_00730 [Candidatus Bathyarchaeia archaeon]|nr:hypothetical protein [Candidatus Bathyarchaeia archaeon]